MCRTTASRTALLALAALALFTLPAAAEETAAAASPLAAGGACADIPARVVDSAAGGATTALGAPEPEGVIGCTATYNCVHGTIVSCSSPVNGTCQASGQGCGRVTCNGQTTWCPGRCVGDHHCFSFCGFAPDAFCDWAGCCDCG